MTEIDVSAIEAEQTTGAAPRAALALPLRRQALIYLGAITLAEALTVLWDPRVGLPMHGALLVILLTHAGLTWETPGHKLLAGIAFAPLIRMLSLSFPLAEVPLVYWYLITSVPIFIACFSTARIFGFSWPKVLFRLRVLPLDLVIGSTGLVLGYVEYLILKPASLVGDFTWEQIWLPALILFVCTGLMEEMVFRGVMQHSAVETLGRWGMVYVAVIFAVLHLGYRSAADVIFVLLVALFFGWVVQRTRSLLGVTLAHGLTNIMLFLVVPFMTTVRPAQSTVMVLGATLPTRIVAVAPTESNEETAVVPLGAPTETDVPMPAMSNTATPSAASTVGETLAPAATPTTIPASSTALTIPSTAAPGTEAPLSGAGATTIVGASPAAPAATRQTLVGVPDVRMVARPNATATAEVIAASVASEAPRTAQVTAAFETRPSAEEKAGIRTITTTPTRSRTATPNATRTRAATATETRARTATAKATLALAATSTSIRTRTPMPTWTTAPTATQRATRTATAIAAERLLAASTPIQTRTATTAPTGTWTATAAPTQTRTITTAPTRTWTATMGPTGTRTATMAPTKTATRVVAPTRTRTVTTTPTRTRTAAAALIAPTATLPGATEIDSPMLPMAAGAPTLGSPTPEVELGPMPPLSEQAAWARDAVWQALENTGVPTDLPARSRWSTTMVRRTTDWVIYRYTRGRWGVDVWAPVNWSGMPVYRVRLQGPNGFQVLAQIDPWGEIVTLPLSVLTPTASPTATPRATATQRPMAN